MTRDARTNVVFWTYFVYVNKIKYDQIGQVYKQCVKIVSNLGDQILCWAPNASHFADFRKISWDPMNWPHEFLIFWFVTEILSGPTTMDFTQSMTLSLLGTLPHWLLCRESAKRKHYVKISLTIRVWFSHRHTQQHQLPELLICGANSNACGGWWTEPVTHPCYTTPHTEITPCVMQCTFIVVGPHNISVKKAICDWKSMSNSLGRNIRESLCLKSTKSEASGAQCFRVSTSILSSHISFPVKKEFSPCHIYCYRKPHKECSRCVSTRAVQLLQKCPRCDWELSPTWVTHISRSRALKLQPTGKIQLHTNTEQCADYQTPDLEMSVTSKIAMSA